MKAALMWTISDFPTLGMLSGWSTKGLIVKTLCEEIQFPPPGKSIRRKPRDYGVTHNWTHFSPFFELPYWETLSLRHNIDVMHTEKNIFENIFFTLLNVRKKTKDNSKARKDFKELGVHRELWIQDGNTMPSAPYVLEKEQILKSFKWIEELELPDGYVSNISRFFYSMELLPVHLATECKLGGLTNFRWMYFVERFLHDLKLNVKNKARAEGSMAERYIEEECVHFCSLYFESKAKTVHNQLRQNEASKSSFDPNLLEVYTYPTYPMLRTGFRILSDDEHKLVTYYILINSPEVGKFLRGFQRLVDKEHPDFNDAKKEEFQKIYFIDWFRRRVEGDQELKAKFKDLIRGPMYDVESFKGCKCNGYKFGCAKEKELTSSNSGVVVIGSSYQGSFDNYYGRLQEVLKLYYHNGNQVVLFKCHWFDHTTHVKVDRNRMITVDVKSKLRAEDVFVLASHAHQVYYAPSITNPKSSCMFENDFSYHEYNEDKNKEKDDDEERSIHEESDSDHDDLA
ncbi:uncharacterized protein LOC141701533 [Apium graveolens]|uniref:uncharacterized protein LOC141701533 n=1 Tax=Apium graveolens TaxID=4045 RepID=UPI003D7BA214